jgi:hypothetical protein
MAQRSEKKKRWSLMAMVVIRMLLSQSLAPHLMFQTLCGGGDIVVVDCEMASVLMTASFVEVPWRMAGVDCS